MSKKNKKEPTTFRQLVEEINEKFNNNLPGYVKEEKEEKEDK